MGYNRMVVLEAETDYSYCTNSIGTYYFSIFIRQKFPPGDIAVFLPLQKKISYVIGETSGRRLIGCKFIYVGSLKRSLSHM